MQSALNGSFFLLIDIRFVMNITPNTMALYWYMRWLCSSTFFFQPILKCSIAFNLPAMVFSVIGDNNGKKTANAINFLKSFVRFSFQLLILLLLFSIFMTFNERYFNDDLVIIVCATVLWNFRHQFSHHSLTQSIHRQCCWFFPTFEAIKIN